MNTTVRQTIENTIQDLSYGEKTALRYIRNRLAPPGHYLYDIPTLQHRNLVTKAGTSLTSLGYAVCNELGYTGP